MAAEKLLSNLELVSRVDTWPYYAQDPEKYKKHMSEFYYFMIQGYSEPFGYIHSSFITAMMPWPSCWSLDHNKRFLTLLSPPDDFESRTHAMHITLRTAHDSRNVAALRNKWANELFPVYSSTGEHVLDMDGCGVDLFGIVNYGVHMIAYVNTQEGRKFWVPRRSKTKMSYPGMLDNTVGGSLRSGERAIDCMVREVGEEAAFPEAYTREHVRACGTLSYSMDRTDDGREGCQHQVQFLYEMELPEDIVPRPFDGEVEGFRLMGIEEVVGALRGGEFKLNCGMTWMAYLVRHGVVNAENEKDLVDICSRLHRKHDLLIV